MSRERFTSAGEFPIIPEPLADEVRARMLAEFREVPTDPDRARAETEWGPRKYFHSIQDLAVSVMDERKEPKDIRYDQACFVKDLEWYLTGLPREEVTIRSVFETVFTVGTSFRWEENPEAVRSLHDVYRRLDDEVIQPWSYGDPVPGQ